MQSSSAAGVVSEPVVLSSDDEDDINNTTPNDKAIVLYDPNSNGSEPQPDPDPIQCRPPPLNSNQGPPRVLPSVGAFTVQCAECFKWRLIPSKEKYEEIREHILERPFSCELAKEWRPEISCDEPTDIEQDGSRLWAIDKPNIAQAPPGWERELRIRGEGSSKFADVYYISPLGKRLRSMVEVQKYLLEHPEFITEGVTLSQFSFQIPKPLQENYVRKRTPQLKTSGDDPNFGMPRPLQLTAANPLSWAAPDEATALQLGRPSFPASYPRDSPPLDLNPKPRRKKARVSKEQHMYSSDTFPNQQHRIKVKGPRPPPNGVYDI